MIMMMFPRNTRMSQPLGYKKNNLDKSRNEAIASSGFHLYLRKT